MRWSLHRGAPKHPTWYHNVKANPNVTVQEGDKVFEMTAREVDGDERAQWWQTAIEPTHYVELQKLTDRKIPVFVLE